MIVEPYFVQNWKSSSEREKEEFFALGFSRALSEWFPLMLDDRAELTGKMHYLVLLIDGESFKSIIGSVLLTLAQINLIRWRFQAYCSIESE